MLYCFCKQLRHGRLNTMEINLKISLRRMNSKHSSRQWPSTTQRKLISLKLPVMPIKFSNQLNYHTMFKIFLMHHKLMMRWRKVNSGFAALLSRNSKQSKRDYLFPAPSPIWLHILTITCSSRTAILISLRVTLHQCKDISMKYAKKEDWMQLSIKNSFR